MKTVWYEAVKAYINKLLPAVILLAFAANGAMFYNDVTSRGEGSWIAKEIGTYRRIVGDYKDKPVEQAYEELKTLNGELQAFISIQILSENMFGDTQESINEQLRQIEEQHPGIIARYNSRDYTLYSGSIEKDSGLIHNIYNQINYIHGYRDYIASMTDRMNEMLSVSVFYQKGTFAYRNIVKTPQDFAPLEDIPLKLDTDAGVVRSTDYALTDVFVIGIALLLCIYLISVEKERKLLLLVKSTRYGRGRSIAAKLALLVLSVAALSFVFYGANILIARQVFGLGDLGRYVQSISDFRGCTAPLTVGQYLLVFLASKAFAAALISLAVFTVILLSSSSSFAYAVIAAGFAAEWAAWQFIPVTSWVNHLKFINLFGFLDAFSLYSNYQNLNVFGQPVNVRLLFVTAAPACMALLAALCYVAFTRFRYTEKIGFIARAIDRVRKLFARLPGAVSLFSHELYKLLVAQKALLILLLLLAMQYYAVSGYFVVRDSDRAIYQHYLMEVGGEVTDGTRAYIAEEQAKFDNAGVALQQAAEDLRNGVITQAEYDGAAARASVLQQRATAFGWITAQYDYINGLRDKGIDAWFVDPMGYTQLFSLNGYGGDVNNQLLLTAAVIACLAAAFAHDNAIRAKKIVVACREGRGRDIAHRYLACYLVALAAAALVYGAQLHNICSWYHLKDWGAPVQSVMAFDRNGVMSAPQFAGFPLNMTIGQYALMMYGIRLSGVVAMVSAVLLVSSLSGGVFVSIFASTAALVAPAVFYLLGFDGARYFSFVEPLSANMFLAHNYPAYTLAALPLFCAGLAVLLLLLARRAYCRLHLA
jgi:ABC-type transport system involved in multi-copper enzyme maturation permease subunit